MHLHVQSILTTSALVGMMIAVMQLLAGWRLQSRSLAYWASASLMLSAGCIFIALRSDIGLPASALAGNGLILLGMGLLFSGIRKFDERPARVDVVAGVTAAGVAALAVSLAFGDDLPDRVTIASLFVAGWAVAAGVTLLQRSGSGPLLSRFASTLILFGVAFAFVLRGISVQLGYLTLDGPLSSRFEIAGVLAALTLVVAWSFGSLFMVLERLASVDDLTGLLNRRATLQSACLLLKEAKTRRHHFALLLADLDHFKSVNDRFGHEVGDAVLRHFARVMRATVRPHDVVGRHGGEEFCIVLPGADEQQALAAAERLRRLAEEQLSRVDGYETCVTLTVGLACFTPDRAGFHEVAELINASDVALYRAKAQGRNRVACAGPVTLENGTATIGEARIAASPST